MIIARYNCVVVKFEYKYKFSHTFTKDEIKMFFLGFFEGSDEEFIKKFKPDYPSFKFMIFNHPKKPLRKDLRKRIEDSKDFSLKLREFNLSKLLD
jgi:hypothetical protein